MESYGVVAGVVLHRPGGSVIWQVCNIFCKAEVVTAVRGAEYQDLSLLLVKYLRAPAQSSREGDGVVGGIGNDAQWAKPVKE